jgi:hypothetical protein
VTSTAIFIPTTAGLRRVCSARFREELPLSQIRLDGSFTPFVQSQAAHQLVSGPLRGLDAGGHSFDLALDGDIEDGRSWELGFATAWSFARFWPAQLCKTPEEAERLIWVTGAIDMDLAPQAASYFIGSKLALSTQLFDQAKLRDQELWVVAPPGLGSDDEAALAGLEAEGFARVLRPKHLQELLDVLGGSAPALDAPKTHSVPVPTAAPDPEQATQPPGLRLPPPAIWVGMGLSALLALGAAAAFWLMSPRSPAPQINLIAHHLSDADKSCFDFVLGGAALTPAPAQALSTTQALALTAQGLCQIEVINPGDQTVSLRLPSALSRLAVHEIYRSEAEIRLLAGGRLTISFSAFPPSQHMEISAQSPAGSQVAFVLEFQ